MITGTKLYAFVLMSFSDDFDDIYKPGIKAACEEVGIYCERVDETHVLGPIYDKIVNAITKADIIIADLTGRNPNVYYETGFAHAQNKVTIHLCKDVNTTLSKLELT
jgi:nucleoside 2-deoxyribosyltransferase